MTECPHKNLELIAEPSVRLQCRHCHLRITPEELEGYCPECYEVYGEKRYDFEEVASTGNPITRYRCEECGVIIETAS